MSDRYYFRAVMIGYFVGLTTTVLVMYGFDAPQPALLYLVPSCLGAAVAAAVRRGQLGMCCGVCIDAVLGVVAIHVSLCA